MNPNPRYADRQLASQVVGFLGHAQEEEHSDQDDLALEINQGTGGITVPTSPEDRARHALRRERTLRLAMRRRDEHLVRNHFDDTTGLAQVDCVCELSNTYFAKRSAFGCRCSKRRKGRPKLAGGMCGIGVRDRIIEWRQEARRLREDALTGRWEEDRPATVRSVATNKSPRVFVLEKQDLAKDGTGYGWFAYRKYRTKAGLDMAAKQLARNGSSWRRSEFRAALQ